MRRKMNLRVHRSGTPLPPAIRRITVDSLVWTVELSEACDFDGTIQGHGFESGAITLNYDSGTGTDTIVLNGNTPVHYGESLTLEVAGDNFQSVATSQFAKANPTVPAFNTSNLPTLVSATVNGANWTLVFSEQVLAASESFYPTGSISGAFAGLSYASGDGTNTLLWTCGDSAAVEEVVTLAAIANKIESDETPDAYLAAFTGRAVTNTTS